MRPTVRRTAGSPRITRGVARGPAARLRTLPAAVAVVSSLALIAPGAASAGAACAGADVVATSPDAPSLATSTVCVLNERRAAAGLRRLSIRADLSNAAASFSATMVRESFFAHRAPAGPDLVGRLTRTGYLRRTAPEWIVGENLAWARGAAATPRGLVAAWMESPGHRRNVLEPAFRDIGIGVAAGVPGAGGDGVTVTTDFGARRLTDGARRRVRSHRRLPRHRVLGLPLAGHATG
jgi:uncharacterized protein YkwD